MKLCFVLLLAGRSYYYYNATGIREDMCGFEEFTHEPDPFEFRPTPPIVLKHTRRPLIGVGAGGDELTIGDKALIACKSCLHYYAARAKAGVSFQSCPCVCIITEKLLIRN